MTILSINTEFTGEVGAAPRIVRIYCNDNYSTVTALNYLNGQISFGGNQFYPTDFIAISYSGGYGWFNPLINSSGITLVATPAPGDAILPVVSGNFSVYSGTTGITHDAGFVPTNASLTKVGMVNGSPVNDNLPLFDSTGSFVDSGATIISGLTSVYGGGSTSNAFVVTGLLSTSVGAASIVTSTNAVSIVHATVARDQLSITFSADPGAGTTVSYIYTTNPIA